MGGKYEVPLGYKLVKKDQHVPKYKRPRIPKDQLTDETAEKILLAAKSDNKEYYLFLLLLARTGRRISEILSLTPKDIVWNEGYMFVGVKKTTRDPTKKCVSFVDDEMKTLLREYIKSTGTGQNERFFKKSDRTYKKISQRYVEKAGLSIYISTHSWRHRLITKLKKAGWIDERIVRITGHQSIDSLATYDHSNAFLEEDNYREFLKKEATSDEN